MNVDYMGMEPQGKATDEEMEKFEKAKKMAGQQAKDTAPEQRKAVGLERSVAPDWVPETDNNGNITLKAEKGDNLQTLQKYLQGSDLSQEKIKQVYNNRSKDGTVTLPSDNYSEAYNYSKTNSQEFTNRISDNSVENYNCYHFAVNGVWEKDIYSFFGSSGAYNMEPKLFSKY